MPDQIIATPGTLSDPAPKKLSGVETLKAESHGLRGRLAEELAEGGAQVSEKHCNFLLNTGDATAAEIEALGEEVRRRVAASSGIELAWEIKRIGVPAGAAIRGRAA